MEPVPVTLCHFPKYSPECFPYNTSNMSATSIRGRRHCVRRRRRLSLPISRIPLVQRAASDTITVEALRRSRGETLSGTFQNCTMANRTKSHTESPDRRERHILVVDDEVALLGLAERILTNEEYSVTTCVSGAKAVEVYSRLHDEIDLVILDMVMPEMNGAETLRLLKKIDPTVRAILCSGFPISRGIPSHPKDLSILSPNLSRSTPSWRWLTFTWSSPPP
jgi:PleD family two-component response regulator